jgi:four helix bundle protein
MRDPKRLEVVELAARLAETTYRATRGFPPDERFGLTTQMRRAAVSVGSNISEGCGRSSDPAFLSFLQIAIGSVCELEYQAMLAQRVGVGDVASLNEVRDMSLRVKQMLSRLNSTVRRKNLRAAHDA